MQIYRYLDIGTAKPTPDQQQTVQHYMIDIIDPDKIYNAGQYSDEASRIIENMEADKKVIVTGGTFLYIKALLSGLIKTSGKDQKIRKKLHKEMKEQGLPFMYNKLREIDPERAEEINENDHVRIIRALEVFYSTGRKLSSLKGEHGFGQQNFDTFKVAIYDDRKNIRNNIDSRVESMFEKGFVEEVEYLRSIGYGPELKSMQSIGYSQVNRYLDDKLTLEETKYLIKRDTKRYAKRQMTWLRRESELNWYEKSNTSGNIISSARIFFDS